MRRFGAFTADLSVLAAWLRQCQIETVVLESTGVDWITLFEVLEERGFEVKLVDAHDARQVPGRKTDVQDGQWLQELHTYGLLRGAFRPEDQICVLRSYRVLPTGMLDFSFCIHYIRHLISTDVLALDGDGHHDVSTAHSTQKPAGSLPEPTTSESVA